VVVGGRLTALRVVTIRTARMKTAAAVKSTQLIGIIGRVMKPAFAPV
jgi:hypothetical protein